MNLEDIKIKLFHSAYNDDIDEEVDYVPYSIGFTKGTNVNPNQKIIEIVQLVDEQREEGSIYAIFLEADYMSVDKFWDTIGDNFCEDLVIFHKDNRIGRVSLNRIFVEEIEAIGVWMDNEAPNSMEIGTQIYEDFSVVEGRYIGILDELILDKGNEELHEVIIAAMYSFIRYLGFKMYYLYTQPKSCVETEYLEDVMSIEAIDVYSSLGFEMVDEDRIVMCKDLWHEDRNRKKINESMKKIYFP